MLREPNRWSEHLAAAGEGEQGIRRARYAVLVFLTAAEKDTLKAVDAQDVVVFLTTSLGSRAHSKQLYIDSIRSFFSWLAAEGRISQDPTLLLAPEGAR